MVDPKTYPKFEAIVGEDKKEKSPPADPSQASANARMWGIWLRAENKRAGVRSG